MIPSKYSSKLGIYENIEVHNNTIKVRVVDNPGALWEALSELKSGIGRIKVVGLEVDANRLLENKQPPTTLMCGEKCCLVIQFIHMGLDGKVLSCFKDFLEDQEICFVEKPMNKALSSLARFGVKCWSGVDLCHLVAKFLKKSSKSKEQVTVTSLGAEVGVVLDQKVSQKQYAARGPIIMFSSTCLDFDAVSFSVEEIKKLVSDVYATYVIASKVLGSL